MPAFAEGIPSNIRARKLGVKIFDRLPCTDTSSLAAIITAEQLLVLIEKETSVAGVFHPFQQKASSPRLPLQHSHANNLTPAPKMARFVFPVGSPQAIPLEPRLLSRHDYLTSLETTPLSRLQVRPGQSLECDICFGRLRDHDALVRSEANYSIDDGEGEPAVLLHGTHYFGESCIGVWLSVEGHNQCPACRAVLFREPADAQLVDPVLHAHYVAARDRAIEMLSRMHNPTHIVQDIEVMATMREVTQRALEAEHKYHTLNWAQHQGAEYSWQLLLWKLRATLKLMRQMLFTNTPHRLVLPQYLPYQPRFAPAWNYARNGAMMSITYVRFVYRTAFFEFFQPFYHQIGNPDPEAAVPLASHPACCIARELIIKATSHQEQPAISTVTDMAVWHMQHMNQSEILRGYFDLILYTPEGLPKSPREHYSAGPMGLRAGVAPPPVGLDILLQDMVIYIVWQTSACMDMGGEAEP